MGRARPAPARTRAARDAPRGNGRGGCRSSANAANALCTAAARSRARPAAASSGPAPSAAVRAGRSCNVTCTGKGRYPSTPPTFTPQGGPSDSGRRSMPRTRSSRSPRARPSPRVRNSAVSWPPIATRGRTGAPRSSAGPMRRAASAASGTGGSHEGRCASLAAPGWASTIAPASSPCATSSGVAAVTSGRPVRSPRSRAAASTIASTLRRPPDRLPTTSAGPSPGRCAKPRTSGRNQSLGPMSPMATSSRPLCAHAGVSVPTRPPNGPRAARRPWSPGPRRLLGTLASAAPGPAGRDSRLERWACRDRHPTLPIRQEAAS